MKKNIELDRRFLEGFISDAELQRGFDSARESELSLLKKNGPGSDFLGWIDLPDEMLNRSLEPIRETISRLRSANDVLVVVGIGGSYLGARSAVEFLAPEKIGTEIIFAGYHLSGLALQRVLSSLEGRKYAINVISKSGTTMETAVTFRIIEEHLLNTRPEQEIRDCVICTTDAKSGALKKIAAEKNYQTFPIPDDVGGRFSVLSPVGLLPLAWCGLDMEQLLKGALDQKEKFPFAEERTGPAREYAVLRNILYAKEKSIEILSNFDQDLHYFGQWWRQLFGESEGKDEKGIFPSCCDFTTDLHSMGQWIQQGKRNIMETFLICEEETPGLTLPSRETDHDSLNYLSGRDMQFINRKAFEATAKAHFEGGVPNISIYFDGRSEYCLGALFFMFEKAAAISGYLLDVNPFDQPGVESYKKKMLDLLIKG